MEARNSTGAHNPLVTTHSATGTPLRYPRVEWTSLQAFDLVIAMARETASPER